ncbi:hypothetical protein DL96DRAFT_1684162 [Flagelloscypha sp. PMI_526]|nr:hypothetical protein DL96DRAFT_1684162 [Flagelloscypha sp. PMI_526]
MSDLDVTTSLTSTASLESSFSHIQCNRSRLLVVGKTGVGKTSLIKAIFKVESLTVSHRERGQSDINAEITSNINPNFVIHDSKGYEPADATIYNELVAFIHDRLTRTESSENIHMVWICIATPCAGSRVLEYGTEQILKLCAENDLPSLVVFTKYDELEGERFMALLDSMPSETPDNEVKIERAAAREALNERRKLCAEFVQRFPLVRYEYVSTFKGHEVTLDKLVKLTEEVQHSQRSHAIPRLLTSATQITPSPQPKIDPSIELEDKRVIGKTSRLARMFRDIL